MLMNCTMYGQDQDRVRGSGENLPTAPNQPEPGQGGNLQTTSFLEINIGGSKSKEEAKAESEQNLPPPPSFEYYAQIPLPPYPSGWQPNDYIEYAAEQEAQAAYWMQQAKLATQHVQGHPLQDFPNRIDGVLTAYDTAVHALIVGVGKGADPQQAMAVLERMRPYLREVPTVMGMGFTTAARIGIQIGFDYGFNEGYEAREKESEDFLKWLKDLLKQIGKMGAVGLGVGVALLLLLGGLAALRR